jgi:signal transduction histidine kinase/CheY-like chemotaxis protein
MKSDWWDIEFDETYNRFRRIFCIIMIISITTRTIFSFAFGFELIFGSPQLELNIAILSYLALMKFIENFNPSVKKIVFYFAIESLNALLKFITIKHDEMLCSLHSTLLTILFQTNIFKSTYWIALVVIKHLLLWFYTKHDIIIGPKNPSQLMIAMAFFSIWLIFEHDKRSYCKEKYLAKKAQKQLTDQLVEIMRSFPDGLIILDKALTPKYMNEKAKNTLNTDMKTLLEVISNIKIQNTNTSILHKINTACFNESSDTVSLGTSKSNDKIYEWIIKTITWDNVECYMITLKDLTEIISLERESIENKTKSAFIRSISHELRTPVNAILLIVNELVKELPNQHQEKLLNIKVCSTLLSYQISDILDYTELQSGTLLLENNPCDLKKYLQDCINLIKIQAKYKGLELKSSIDSLIPDRCNIDGYRVQKVLLNLLSNAVKFTNKGIIEVYAKQTDSGIEVKVKDTGIGIKKERIDHIFAMFSDESNSALSGLGLFMSKNILKLLNCHLNVTSELGRGSLFSFLLPMGTNPSDCSEDLQIPNEYPDYPQIPKFYMNSNFNDYPKVMIVDDNDFNRLCLASILERNGIKYIQAINGEAAVKKILKYNDKPIKCVIMDCNMPVMDGWEATKSIISYYEQGLIKSLPVVIGHTAYSSKEDIQRCYDSGMTTIVFKPTTEENILSIISKYN